MAPLCSCAGLVGPVPKVMTFLSLWTKPELDHTNQTWHTNQMNGSIPGCPRPKKVRPTQCAVKVMFIVAYDIDGAMMHHTVPPRQTVNAAYYCMFLKHHLRPALRTIRLHLVLQNHISLHNNGKSLTGAAVTDVLRRWQWAARGPVQHKRWNYPCYRAINTEHQQRWWWYPTPSKHIEGT